ncbi:hypothetical protein Aph02nite_05900 [Actinoplanes philippinensis]|nr:hypothetical protein Aph02nite_05900 [Actinoplanes philippinensis]
MKLIALGRVQIRSEDSMDGAGCCDIATSSPPRPRPPPGSMREPGPLTADLPGDGVYVLRSLAEQL